jgi:hypothetical protein
VLVAERSPSGTEPYKYIWQKHMADLLATPAPPVAATEEAWIVSVIGKAPDEWNVTIWRKGLGAAVVGPFCNIGEAQAGAERWKAAFANRPLAPAKEGEK